MESSDAHTPLTARGLFQSTLSRVWFYYGIERKFLVLLFTYALAIGIFNLIVPLTVQELVNTFAYAVQPLMALTLATVMVVTLLFIGMFRVRQTDALENHGQRLFSRTMLALAKELPYLRDTNRISKSVNYLLEAEYFDRALYAFLIDFMNMVVGGFVGVALLTTYHPFFLLYSMIVIAGFTGVLTIMTRGGLRVTLAMSDHKYEVLHWFQDLARNILHLRSSASPTFLAQRANELLVPYLHARKMRTNILTYTQFKSAVIWQAVVHSGMIALGGYLLSSGQITLGQFVASEVIITGMVNNSETVARRMYSVFYAFTALHKLGALFSTPRDTHFEQAHLSLPDVGIHGIRLTCKGVGFAYPNSPPVFRDFTLEVAPGEKVAVIAANSVGKTTLACVLAGLHTPTSGFIQYNGVDLRDLDIHALNNCRGLILDSQLTLLDGTLEDNIAMGRPVSYDDIKWALRFVDMEDEVEALPLALRTPTHGGGKEFTSSQMLRLLVARAIVTRPQLLILDGTLHNMLPVLRETILRRLCSKEEPWSVIFVSNDPTLSAHVDRRIVME
ncbi:MAG: ATP-binding cassette domain-containing protein [Nitrospira sp.]|nr:ATP-binding cassette domain-containing protein [Nitrospira sp.]